MTLFVVNPRASGGRLGRQWPRFEKHLTRLVEDPHVTWTTEAGSAVTLVKDAVEQGEQEVCIVGGDGSVNEAVNGIMAASTRTVRLTIIPVGSGHDYAKTLGLPAGLDRAADILCSEAFLEVDVGLATYQNQHGEEETRWFANILDAGFPGRVVDRVNRSRKPFGGRVAFLWATVTSLLSYDNEVVQVEVDGRPMAEGPMNSVIVANGRFFGSGLQPAPMAELDDGLLDVVLFGDVTAGEAIRNLGQLRRGEHLGLASVEHRRGREVRATSEARVLTEMDGELVGRLPLRAKVLPGRLRVRCLADEEAF